MGGSLGQSVTLANSIIGVGILAMPFCFQQCGAVLAVLMLLVSGLVSRLTCYFLLKSAIMARRRNFEFLAFHVFGAPGKLLVEVGIIGFLMGTCIAYFVVVGDLGPQIICKMFNINQSDVLRTSVMVIVSLVCVLPLGLLRNVDSLSNVSAATIGFYFCLVIKIIAEAASQLYSGTGRSKMELWKPEGILQCVPIFSMALFCQTQLFEIFETLPVLSLEKMNVVTKNAINICTSVYVMVGLFGYIAFCTQSISGNILVSLSPTMASDVIKLGFVMSLAFSFPLIIFPCRASLYSLLYRKVLPSHHDHIINHSIPEGTFRCITVGIIAISLLVSLMIPNIELVLGLVGSTIGVMVCVVFPAACFVNVTVKNTNERVLAKMVLCLGIVVMVLGTYANLQAAETKLEHYDERYITQDRIDKIVKDFFETNKYSKQSEDAILKPETKTGHEIIEDKKSKVLEANIVKDSAVQPPNPVAPVPQSNEKHPTDTDRKFLAKVVDDIPKEEKPAKLKSSNEVKDKGKLDGDIEGGGDEESVINKVDDKKAEGENKSKYVIKDATKDETVDKIVAQSVVNQNNLEMLKQQALIDTIKQHGQEQQELIKEQKEILDELKKTKLEIEKNKKENIDKEQAKKLAVESIQKIANIAIQSLGGVTDKPIEESKFKIENNDGNKLNELIKSPLQSAKNIGDLPEKAKLTQKTDIINQEQANDKKAPFEVIIKNVDEVINKLEEISHQDADNMNNNISNNVAAPSAKGNSVADDVQKNKLHVHSPDEPNSYVRGEDLEKVKHENKLSPSSLDALIKNVPVPMVMNQNYQNVGNFVEPNDDKNVEPQMQRNSNQNNEKPVVEEAVKSNQIHFREKREITCTDKSFRNEGNRKICKNIKELNEINENGIDIMISQKLSVPDEINLGKVDLVDQPSMDKNMIHQIRGLKSINETEPS